MTHAPHVIDVQVLIGIFNILCYNSTKGAKKSGPCLGNTWQQVSGTCPTCLGRGNILGDGSCTGFGVEVDGPSKRVSHIVQDRGSMPQGLGPTQQRESPNGVLSLCACGSSMLGLSWQKGKYYMKGALWVITLHVKRPNIACNSWFELYFCKL